MVFSYGNPGWQAIHSDRVEDSVAQVCTFVWPPSLVAREQGRRRDCSGWKDSWWHSPSPSTLQKNKLLSGEMTWLTQGHKAFGSRAKTYAFSASSSVPFPLLSPVLRVFPEPSAAFWIPDTTCTIFPQIAPRSTSANQSPGNIYSEIRKGIEWGSMDSFGTENVTCRVGN